MSSTRLLDRRLSRRFVWAVFAALLSPAFVRAEVKVDKLDKLDKLDKFESEILAFEKQDREHPAPKDPILFVGSSSIRMWKLKESFPDLELLNRGFGGSTIAESLHYADRIILPYKPRLIVFYAGGNDLNGGATPEAVVDDFRALLKKVHGALPKTRIIYISLNPTVKRLSQDKEVRQFNSLIEALTKKDKLLTFLNVAPLMRDADGGPRPDLLREDGLHMNPEGYKIWSKALRPLLK